MCLSCERSFPTAEIEAQIRAGDIPACRACGGLVKPDIVFFGEAVKGMERAEQLVRESDLLLIIGSSLTVFPAASLPSFAGGRIVVVTRGPVAVPFGARRIDADIETFFRGVATAMSELGAGSPSGR
jgi:NAD-dependent deacetylase